MDCSSRGSLFFILIWALSHAKYYSLPSGFSLDETNTLNNAISNASRCLEDHPNYFQDIRAITSKLHVTTNYTKEGYYFCFPHVFPSETSKWNELRLLTSKCHPIPKILHQQWNDKNIPSKWKELHNGWKEKNPDWLVLLWTDGDSAEWMETHFPWFMPTYNSYPYHIERIDALRYFLMYAYGGVYVDIDFECVEPLSRYMHMMSRPLGVISPDNSGVSNSMLASVPGHHFWEYCMNDLIPSAQRTAYFSFFKHDHVINTAGPGYIGVAVAKNGSKEVCTFSKDLFAPCDFCQESCNTCDNCFTIHHYAKIWNNWTSNVTNWFQCNPEYFVVAAVCLAFFGFFVYKRLGPRLRRRMVGGNMINKQVL